jgi:hypothetical protein
MSPAPGVQMPPVMTISTMIYADPGHHAITIEFSEGSGSATSGSREDLERIANDNIPDDKEKIGEMKFIRTI